MDSSVLVTAVLTVLALVQLGGPARGATALPEPETRAEHLREIERVLAAARVDPPPARASVVEQVASTISCAEFSGSRYCLLVGWTTQTEDEVESRIRDAVISESSAGPVEPTGDLSSTTFVSQSSSLTRSAREERDRFEFTHALEGLTSYQQEMRELAADRELIGPGPGGPESVPDSVMALYPEIATLLSPRRLSEQIRDYYCGPGAMQMLHWGWGRNVPDPQTWWSARLGTEAQQATAISNMVSVANVYTSWGSPPRDRYDVKPISGMGYAQWWLMIVRHAAVQRQPIILHPQLETDFFPYLDDDGAGHCQVGRGYTKNSRIPEPVWISYFEPFNQQRFDRSERYIERVQWRRALSSYRANMRLPHQNIGV